MQKGCLLTFEGGDGAGKTTLISKLYAYLVGKGLSVIQTRAPGGTKVGEGIRHILLHQDHPLDTRCELFLFLADRAQHVREVILPALEKGQIVLCDRYNDSTLAYQGGARGEDKAFVEGLCRYATRDLIPTRTFYLDIDPKLGLERVQRAGGSKDRIESEKLSFHQSIRSAFHEIAEREPERFCVLDASLPPETVYNRAISVLDALF